jgi:hypothetical protein
MSEGWIAWNGTRRSRCPVPAGTYGHLWFRCEPADLERGAPYDISIYRWDDTRRKEDIIAYRLAITEDSQP